MASLGISLQLRDKTIEDSRVVFGGISGKPYRDAALEAFLKGKTLNADLGEQAVSVALASAAPRKYNATKIDMAKGLLASGLARLNLHNPGGRSEDHKRSASSCAKRSEAWIQGKEAAALS